MLLGIIGTSLPSKILCVLFVFCLGHISFCLTFSNNLRASYSPLMAEHLSYLSSKSHSYVYQDEDKRISNADENYARETMQLFSSEYKYALHNLVFAPFY